MSRNQILKPVVFIASMLPFAKLVVFGLQDRLGTNPIERVTHTTGWWTLAFLMITLAISPMRRFTGQYWLVQYRRMLGLFAFFYGTLHLLTYVWADQFFDFEAILRDIGKRPFILMGMLSFVAMVPLAITSTKGWIQRLGKKWQTLHRLIYVSALAGVIHFWWLVKKDISEPLSFGVILGVLFLARIAITAMSAKRTRTASAD